jgi:hypothetical protein
MHYQVLAHQMVETTLLLDNNSSFANRFSNTKAMRKQFYFYFWPVTVNLSHSGLRATRMGYIDMEYLQNV